MIKNVKTGYYNILSTLHIFHYQSMQNKKETPCEKEQQGVVSVRDGVSNIISSLGLSRWNLGGEDFSFLDLTTTCFKGVTLNCYSSPISFEACVSGTPGITSFRKTFSLPACFKGARAKFQTFAGTESHEKSLFFGIDLGQVLQVDKHGRVSIRLANYSLSTFVGILSIPSGLEIIKTRQAKNGFFYSLLSDNTTFIKWTPDLHTNDTLHSVKPVLDYQPANNDNRLLILVEDLSVAECEIKEIGLLPNYIKIDEKVLMISNVADDGSYVIVTESCIVKYVPIYSNFNTPNHGTVTIQTGYRKTKIKGIVNSFYNPKSITHLGNVTHIVLGNAMTDPVAWAKSGLPNDIKDQLQVIKWDLEKEKAINKVIFSKKSITMFPFFERCIAVVDDNTTNHDGFTVESSHELYILSTDGEIEKTFTFMEKIKKIVVLDNNLLWIEFPSEIQRLHLSSKNTRTLKVFESNCVLVACVNRRKNLVAIKMQQDNTIRLFRMNSLTLITSIYNFQNRNEVLSMSFSDDGNYLMVGYSDGSFVEWDLHNLLSPAKKDFSFAGSILGIANLSYHPNNDRVFISLFELADNRLEYEHNTYELIREEDSWKYRGEYKDFWFVSFDHSGKYILTKGEESKICIRDSETNELLYSWPLFIVPGTINTPPFVELSYDCNYLITNDQFIRNLSDSQNNIRLSVSGNSIKKFIPNDQILCVCNDRNSIEIFSLDGVSQQQITIEKSHSILLADTNETGSTLLVVSEDGIAYIFQRKDGSNKYEEKKEFPLYAGLNVAGIDLTELKDASFSDEQQKVLRQYGAII